MSVRQNLISACLLILSASLTTPVYARSVTDHLNRTVEVPDHIERVAVADIFPYASAACVYLGSCRKIVAMHPSSMNAARSGLLHELYPEVADINTSVMQGAEVNLEALMGLRPDVVFVNAGNKRLIERLEAAGLPALAVSTGKWDYDVLKLTKTGFHFWTKPFPEKATPPLHLNTLSVSKTCLGAHLRPRTGKTPQSPLSCAIRQQAHCHKRQSLFRAVLVNSRRRA